MNKILAIAWNMVKRTIASRKGMLTYILLPSIVIAAIISVTGGMEGDKPTVLYNNMDTGAAGRHLLAELENTGDYKLIARSDEAALKEGIIQQEGEAGISIPAEYTAQLAHGQQPELSVYELRASETSILVKMKVNTIAGEMLDTARTVNAVNGGAGDAEAKLGAILKQAEQHNVGSTRTDYDLYPGKRLASLLG
ncbi:hypothetical protein [Paenibacillus sonchi]|uniref:hypothetical protein n=1 Tax=Paenibacillus sonchi TaxID=373687 RepID=UPI001F454DD5|nr:hypothetical protein [Paenibacillus sonchi]